MAARPHAVEGPLNVLNGPGPVPPWRRWRGTLGGAAKPADCYGRKKGVVGGAVVGFRPVAVGF